MLCDIDFLRQSPESPIGYELSRLMAEPKWQRLEIAVAWVSPSGVKCLSESLINFLQSGKHLSFLVGIDMNSTTRDGLQALLDLESYGSCEIFTRHKEGYIFHPKTYLFRNENDARLIVGSSNFTSWGLFDNEEASIAIEGNVNHPTIRKAISDLEDWRDTKEGYTVRLDRTILDQMVYEQYIPLSESDRWKWKNDKRRPKDKRPSKTVFAVPPKRKRIRPTQITLKNYRLESSEKEILMILRKGSEKNRRPTQTQIPLSVVDSFFRDYPVRHVSSDKTYTVRPAIGKTGKRHTAKLEIPELLNASDPVIARFVKTDEIVYNLYDEKSTEGQRIVKFLGDGITNESTKMSHWDVERATLWRFVES